MNGPVGAKAAVGDPSNVAGDSGTRDVARGSDNTGMPFVNWVMDEGGQCVA